MRWTLAVVSLAMGLAVILLPGGPTAGESPTAAAQPTAGTTRLVLQSVDVDRTGIIEPESWTAVQGSARFAPFYGTADFSFPIPSVIPTEGAPVTLSVTVNAVQQGFGPALGIHGEASFVGPSTQANAFAPAGQSNTGTATVTIVPRSVAPGTAVLIYIGLQSGPRVNYRFRAEAAGCTRAQERTDLTRFQASACPPPKCAGVAATIEADPDVPGPIFGTAGRDVIVGTAENDLILGRGGNDLICGRAGNDRILGNAGADTVNGEEGNDRIDGGEDASRDRLAGQAGADNIVAGPGDDLVVGGRGADTLSGGPGPDRIDAGPGDDEANGGLGDDTMLGGPGADEMDGDRGDDVMRGGDGMDSLLGGPDDDLMFGDAGYDLLAGEDEDDILFAGAPEGAGLAGGPGVDRCVGGSNPVGCERLR